MNNSQEIGTYAMIDALRMIPHHWITSLDVRVFAENYGIRVDYNDYSFLMEGDGIVYVTKGDVKKSYDDHAFYAHKDGKKFLEVCKERFDAEILNEERMKEARKIQSETAESINRMFIQGVIDAHQKNEMLLKVKSIKWLNDRYLELKEEV